jgi:hypothetical protein
VLSVPPANAPVSRLAFSAASTSKSGVVVASTNVGKAFTVLLPTQPKGTAVSLSYVGPGNKVTTLAASTTKSAGAVNLPAVAFKTPGKYTLTVKVGKITKTITVTVKK